MKMSVHLPNDLPCHITPHISVSLSLTCTKIWPRIDNGMQLATKNNGKNELL